jgi:hypothetical protein
MNTNMKSYILSTILLLFCGGLSAQNYWGLLYPGSNVISGGINAEPGLGFSADYLTQPGAAIKGKSIGFLANLNVPLFSQRGFDFDLRLGAGVLVDFTDQWKMISGLSWGLYRSTDINGKFWATGFKIDLLPGHYGSKWIIGPHLAFDYRPWVHLKHSDYAKQAFENLYPNGSGKYNEPKDGWFRQSYTNLRTGVHITYFKPDWNINLTAGLEHDFDKVGLFTLPDVGVMPFYGGVNFGYRIKNKQ